MPQCPLEDIVDKFNDETILLAHSNDTEYPFYYNETVQVVCQRGYTFPDGDIRKNFQCGYGTTDNLGWFDDSNNLLDDIMCSKGFYCIYYSC